MPPNMSDLSFNHPYPVTQPEPERQITGYPDVRRQEETLSWRALPKPEAHAGAR